LQQVGKAPGTGTPRDFPRHPRAARRGPLSDEKDRWFAAIRPIMWGIVWFRLRPYQAHAQLFSQSGAESLEAVSWRKSIRTFR
jgi:membrane peptidoglycan carboxypeptidase